MKNVSLVGKMRYFANIFIVMQGILLALLTIFLMNNKYMDTWAAYPDDNRKTVVYLRNLSAERSVPIEQYLEETARNQGLFIVRRDILLKNDGSFGGYKAGILGTPADERSGLSFLGQNVLNTEDLKELLVSENQNASIGVDKGSIDSLTELPGFRIGQKIVVKKMEQVIRESNTINGTYSVIGLETEQEQNEFLAGLETVTGMESESLTKQMSGETQDSSFMQLILMILLSVQIALNILFFLAMMVKNLRKQGNLALLGWSRSAFVYGVFGRNFVFAVASIPVIVILGYLISGWKPFSLMLASYFTLAAVVNTVLVSFEMAAASAVVLMTKSLDAIHGKIPARPLYILGILAYFFISIGMIICGSYVDQPLEYLSENSKLSKNWKDVSEYQMLTSFSTGEDTDSFSGQSKQFDQDIYNWYSEIADEEGVYLTKTTFYGERVLMSWKENKVYSSVPESPFWYFAVSPNYLKTMGIIVDEQLLRRAKEGARLYLFPESLKEAEKNQLKGWIEESTVQNLSDGDIQTEFTQNPDFEYADYESNKEYFTWAAATGEETRDRSPIIYVATPENMRYFENESLKATGFNGYIKFIDSETMEKYTRQELLNTYHLSDNKLVFAGTQNYIDGMQKELLLTVAWFGIIFAILLFLLIALLLTLAMIFRMANQEKIYVKKFLGFRFWQIYRGPMILLACIIGIELIFMLMLRSQFGFLLILLVSLLQCIIFFQYMSRNELSRMLLRFKGE